MTGGLALLVHSTRRTRTLVLVMSVILAGFQVLLNLAASVFQDTNTFNQLAALLPDFVRQLLGPAAISLLSYGGIVCLGYFHMVVVGALVGLVIGIATEPAAEIETRFMDLVMAHSISRHWIITRTVLLLICCPAFVLGCMMLGTWASLRWLAPKETIQPTFHLVRLLALNVWVLLVGWGGVALALAAPAKRRSTAGAIAGLLALTSYLADYLARVWKPARSLSRLSPFHYFNAMDFVTSGTLPQSDLYILAGLALAGFALSYLLFARRDL